MLTILSHEKSGTEKLKKEPTPFEKSLSAAFEALLAANPYEPEWLRQLRIEAFERFQNLGMPSHRHESWRSFDLKPITGTAFRECPETLMSPDIFESLQMHLLQDEAVYRLVFLNGRFQPALSSLIISPEDQIPSRLGPEQIGSRTIIANLQTVLAQAPDYLQQALEMENRILMPEDLAYHSDPFIALTEALFEDGVFIHLPEGTELDKPIQLIFATLPGAGHKSGPFALYPRCWVIARQHAKAQLYTQFVTLGETLENYRDVSYLHAPLITLSLEPHANLDYLTVHREGRQGQHLGTVRAVVPNNAKLDITSVSLGGSAIRHQVITQLVGEHADCRLNGLNILNGDARVYHRTEVAHEQPACTSRQLYKSIVDNRAVSEFVGTLFVRRNAQLTDAAQLNKNLTLSDDARVLTQPQLRIDADDVKCSHGATVGQLEEEELFYLETRGLSRDRASRLLIYGFAEEVVETVHWPVFKRYLDCMILQKLGQTEEFHH